MNMETEPVRITSWWVGAVVLFCQAVILWGIDTAPKAIAVVIAGQVISAVTTGEITRRKVTPV